MSGLPDFNCKFSFGPKQFCSERSAQEHRLRRWLQRRLRLGALVMVDIGAVHQGRDQSFPSVRHWKFPNSSRGLQGFARYARTSELHDSVRQEHRQIADWSHLLQPAGRAAVPNQIGAEGKAYVCNQRNKWLRLRMINSITII